MVWRWMAYGAMVMVNSSYYPRVNPKCVFTQDICAFTFSVGTNIVAKHQAHNACVLVLTTARMIPNT
jgi:hypothetical protein